jgi:sec-independent protein translocase protein TatC
VAPALYKHERKLVIPLLVSSSLLFYIGMAFAYFVVFPLAFGFLTHTAPEGVQVSTDIASYLSFVMALFMAFGVAFEVPVAIVLLCWVGVRRRKTCVRSVRISWSGHLWSVCC